MLILAAVVLGLFTDVARCQDFAHTNGDFQFIYHEHHNELLTIYNETCYFTYIPFKEQAMMHDSPAIIENGIMQIIQARDYDKIWPSSLGRMRDEYQDLLANFKCVDKDVYTLQVFLTVTTGILECDFESTNDPMCGFTQDPDRVMSWISHTSDTPTEHNHVHLKDHTCGLDNNCGPGHYLYMAGSSLAPEGEKSHLISQTFNTEHLAHYCLRFHYNMFGKGQGTLNVYAVDNNTYPLLSSPIWSFSGTGQDHGNIWHEAEININTTSTFQVVFEGVKSHTEHNVQSDIALDDIALFYGPCFMHPASGQVRLVEGTSPSNGRLEVYVEGRWGTVCGEGFHPESASVACNMLGYTGTQPILETHSFYGQTSAPVVLTEVHCVGTEKTLLQCPHTKVGCPPSRTIGLVCQPLNDSAAEPVRLVGGHGPYEGRVEVLMYGRWGTVCGLSFDAEDAIVVCRMLGYNESQPTVEIGSFYGEGPGHVWLNELKCDGTESSIMDCNGHTAQNIQCRHDHADVGVNCRPSSETQVRLAGNGNSATEGRVEVYVDGRWGTICANHFQEEEARVICRMLGHESIHPVARDRSFYGLGEVPVLLSEVDCVGNETNILECHHLAVRDPHGCTNNHLNDVGVVCDSPQPLTSLVGRSAP